MHNLQLQVFLYVPQIHSAYIPIVYSRVDSHTIVPMGSYRLCKDPAGPGKKKRMRVRGLVGPPVLTCIYQNHVLSMVKEEAK